MTVLWNISLLRFSCCLLNIVCNFRMVFSCWKHVLIVQNNIFHAKKSMKKLYLTVQCQVRSFTLEWRRFKSICNRNRWIGTRVCNHFWNLSLRHLNRKYWNDSQSERDTALLAIFQGRLKKFFWGLNQFFMRWNNFLAKIKELLVLCLIWNAMIFTTCSLRLDSKSADNLFHFGNHFGKYKVKFVYIRLSFDAWNRKLRDNLTFSKKLAEKISVVLAWNQLRYSQLCYF